MTVELRNLDISLKNRIDEIKKKSGDNSSANSYMSMYMWRGVYGNELFLDESMYSLKVRDRDNTWFFPCGDEEAKRNFIRDRLNEGGLHLVYAKKEDLLFIRDYFSSVFDIISRPEDSEYIYSVSEHKELAGKKYSRIRREIHNVDNKHDFELIHLLPENLHYVKEIEQKWLETRDVVGSLQTKGEELDFTVFDNMNSGGITGSILLENGKPVSAVAGFLLDDNMIDIFYGAQTNEVNSSLDYVLHEFVNRLNSQIEWFNLEEDLGIEGLRNWKEKLQPFGKIDMWECRQL